MRTLKLLLYLLIAPVFCFAQTTQTVPIPPCTLNFTLSNINLTSPTFTNLTPGCDKWTVTAYVVGSGTFTLTLQSAPPATTATPGSWITYPGTTATGSNPLTATGIATFTNGTTATQFMRLLLNVSSGTATVYGVLQGSQTVVSKGGGGGGGGGGPTIAGTTNEIAVSGAGCTSPSTATCTISIPNNPILPGLVTASGFSSSENFSGSLQMSGITSGQVVLTVDDIAGTAIVYVWPSTNGTSGQVLSDGGSTTCPTLPPGYPATCHQLAWIAGGGGSGFAVQVNGTTLTGLTSLNLVAGSNMTLTPSGSGTYTVTFTSTGGATGGATNGYSAPAVTLPAAGTTFIPPVGGGLPSSTEANVQWVAPVTATLSQMSVVLSAVPGTGNTIAFTFRDGGSSQTVTCTVTAAIKTCTDSTHSFSVTAGDLLDIQIVTTGIVAAAPNVQIGFQYGGGGGGGGGGNKTTFGAYPSFPSSPSSGDLFFANNSPHMFSWNGSAWLPYSLWSGIPLTSFVNSGYSWVNQDNAAITAADVDFVVSVVNPTTTSDEFHIYQSGASLSIPYTYTMHFQAPSTILPSSSVNLAIGLLVKDTVSGNFISTEYFYPGNNGTSVGQLIVTRWNNPTSVNGSPFVAAFNGGVAQSGLWLRIRNDGTNRVFSVSFNGVDYPTTLIEAAGTFITENATGFGFYTINGNVTSQYRLDHLSITNP